MHWIDPAGLPETRGTLECFVVNQHGEVDGFVMKGQEQTSILVHTPPHMEAELTCHLKPGEQIRVRGVRPRGADVFAAVAVTGESGRQIADEGPHRDRDHPKIGHRKMDAEGTVRLSLFGPKGELRGALLADGTIIRVGPKEAESVVSHLIPGAKIAVSGDGVETKHGRVIHAKQVGSDTSDLRPVKRPRQKAKPKPKPDHEARA